MQEREETITYWPAGQIERFYGRSYKWVQGWAEFGKVDLCQPWRTRKECMADSKINGCVAQFYTH